MTPPHACPPPIHARLACPLTVLVYHCSAVFRPGPITCRGLPEGLQRRRIGKGGRVAVRCQLAGTACCCRARRCGMQGGQPQYRPIACDQAVSLLETIGLSSSCPKIGRAPKLLNARNELRCTPSIPTVTCLARRICAASADPLVSSRLQPWTGGRRVASCRCCRQAAAFAQLQLRSSFWPRLVDMVRLSWTRRQRLRAPLGGCQDATACPLRTRCFALRGGSRVHTWMQQGGQRRALWGRGGAPLQPHRRCSLRAPPLTTNSCRPHRGARGEEGATQ